MNFELVGLNFSFVGSLTLIFEVLFSMGKKGDTVFFPNPISRNKTKGFHREEKQKDGKYKEVFLTKKEILIILALSFLSVGFLFQIIGNTI